MEALRYVLPHLAAGCVGGLVATFGLVATNVASLRDLIVDTPGGWLAGALLTLAFVMTFGSAAVGRAILQLGQDER